MNRTTSSSLSFAEFMERALYDPEKGYYASGRVQIGKSGDFFTNVSVGKIYGKILILFFEEVWENMGRPTPFTLVEQGAHDGRLTLDILEATASSPDFLQSIDYYIVEPFSFHRQRQQERLQHQEKIFWVERLEELPALEGIHFSNELVDAFPIHLLRWNGREWLEQRVASMQEQEKKFWITTSVENRALKEIIDQLPTTLAPGFLWEVRLGIAPWLREMEHTMKRGMILIADYGYAGSARFAPYRAEGSIACYEHHRRYDNPLEHVGERDITAHVDFTDLAQKALQHHLDILGYSDQHHFLMGAAEKWLRTFETKPPSIPEQRDLRLLQTLLNPATMGRSFQFLGLGKGVPKTAPLSGFRYQRPGVTELGLERS